MSGGVSKKRDAYSQIVDVGDVDVLSGIKAFLVKEIDEHSVCANRTLKRVGGGVGLLEDLSLPRSAIALVTLDWGALVNDVVDSTRCENKFRSHNNSE